MLGCDMMDDDYTLSLAQIAQLLNDAQVDIAESTVRKYAKLYKEFLPSRKLEGVRWEKFQPTATEIIKRIFTLSEAGSSRHDIKAQLKTDGYTITIEGEADATANEPAQPYNHTPPTASQQHGNHLPDLQAQHSDLIADYNASVMREAAASLQLYHRLVEEKNYQIEELEALTERLKRDKAAIEKKYKAELNNVLGEVVQWQARASKKRKQKPQRQLEPAG